MAKKKSKKASAAKTPPPPPKKSGVNRAWIVAAIAIVGVGILIALADSGDGGKQGATPSAEEQRYIGRLLPAGYEEPQVAERTLYTSTVQMTDVAATQDTATVSVPLSDVVENKIVKFDYSRADGQTLPMIAYIRPSGRLFVGVSFCPPCEGEGQRIEADGTLTCEACGTKRNLETDAGLSGPCKLYPLDEVPAAVDGDRILVDATVLDTWTAQPLDRPIG